LLRDSVGPDNFITTLRPPSPLVSALRGLDSVDTFAASPSHIYGVNAEQHALVVINGDDGSQRQLFVNGNSATDFFGSEVTLHGLGGAKDVVVSSDGSNVYVASPLDEGIATFRRDPVTGNLTYVGFTDAASSSMQSLVL